LGEDFSQPETPVQNSSLRFINEIDHKGRNISMSKWWENINSDEINKDVEELLQNNLGIKQATQRIIQAEERDLIQKGSLYPSTARFFRQVT